MNERKQSIVDDFIGNLIGPVRFKKYHLMGDLDNNGGKYEYYDYDILLMNNKGKFEFSGFIQWNENEIRSFDFGFNWCRKKSVVIYCLFPKGMEILRKYIIKILRERIKRKQTKDIPYPPLK